MMTVLIVDDQTSVVNGIHAGIRWKEAGVDRVLEAYHAAGAKKIFRNYRVDILLCDIEMPAEDGISLLRWVRKMGYQTECIFLTAHAEFAYARQALQLGSVDYIIQPARYEDIEKTIYRTVNRIQENMRAAEYYDYGKLLSHKKMKVLDGLFSRILSGGVKDTSGLLEDCRRLNIPLYEKSSIYLVRIVLVAGTGGLEDEELRQYSLLNILAELFSDYGQEVMLTSADDNSYMLLVFQAENMLIDRMGTERLLLEFIEQCRLFADMHIACYSSEQINPADISVCAVQMAGMARDNVTGQTGVFWIEDNRKQKEYGDKREIPFFQKQKYIDYIANGYISSAGREIIKYLEKLKSAGVMDAAMLMNCYQDFQEILYASGEKNGIWVNNILRQPQMVAYGDKSKSSLENLEDYIGTVLEIYESSMRKKEEDKTQIEKVIEYIQCNIEKELKRQEIADALHLNPDYLSRIFTKAVGKPLKTYIIEEKMQLAKILLTTTPLPVGDIAARIGYTNFSHFSQSYKKVMGKQPFEERKKENCQESDKDC